MRKELELLLKQIMEDKDLPELNTIDPEVIAVLEKMEKQEMDSNEIMEYYLSLKNKK